MSTSLVTEINSEERGGVVVLQLEGETIERCALESPSKLSVRELGALIQHQLETGIREYVSYFVGAIDERL